MSLYAAWALDEGSGTTITDYSGNGRNMTVVGSNSWVTGHDVHANAFQSGTSSSDGAYWDAGTWQSALSGDVTLMMWYKHVGTADSNEHVGGMYQDFGTAYSAVWSYRNLLSTAGSPEVTVRDSSATLRSVAASGTHTDTSWHHAAFVFHANGHLELYLDGTKVVDTTPGSNPIGTNVRYIGVGGKIAGGASESVVQDMRVFDSALTSTDINAWMNTPVGIVSGTADITTKKMTVSGLGQPQYNTGTSVTAGSVSQSTHPTLTIPAGVTEGECMIIGVDLFGFTGDTGLGISLSPSVSGNDWTQLGSLASYDDGSLSVYGTIFVRQATASDAGSTLTFSFTGTPGTDQKWWSVAMVSYLGLDASKIDRFSTSGASSGTDVTLPTGNTTRDDAWAIYVVPAAVNSSGTLTTPPAGTTQRINANDSGVACGIADTNGSVGSAGTSIGGGSWTKSNAGGWMTAFSLAVAPKLASTPNAGAVTTKKVVVSGTGTVTGTFSAVLNNSSGGVDSYDVTSQANGTGTTTTRVIVPANPDPYYPHAFLYMLPVEADGGNVYGDPISIASSLGLADTYNLTIISPGYDLEPWFADNPTDPTILQETFTVWVTDWAKANLAVTGSEKHYLMGFSKSGLGGGGLLFHHPLLFEKAVLWDTPFDDNAYDHFGGSDAAVYGTADNFTDNYELDSSNITKWKAPFTSTNRIWIADGASYATEVDDFDDLLTAIGIPHTYDGTTFASDTHAWHEDWITAGLADILDQVPSVHVTTKKMIVSGSGTATGSVNGTGDVTFKKLTIAVSVSLKVSGTGAVSLKKMTVAGSAGVIGTGSIVLKKMTVSLSGSVKLSGSGDISFQKMIVAGVATAPIVGTGSISMKKMLIGGSAKAHVSGTAAVTFSKMFVSGSSTEQTHQNASPLFIFSPL